MPAINFKASNAPANNNINRELGFSQRGLTLLEVLIALSLFAMIGIASFRVLSTVAKTQQVSEQHSQQLAVMQKMMAMMDADFQQLAMRDIRVSEYEQASYLRLNTDGFAVEMTRAGWSNPLMLTRSTLQRIAYDTGFHPDSNKANSLHYQDQRSYLRRHYWAVLDRTEHSQPFTQVLMPEIEQLKIRIINDEGIHTQWPPPSIKNNPSTNANTHATTVTKNGAITGIEVSFEHASLGKLTRLYRVN